MARYLITTLIAAVLVVGSAIPALAETTAGDPNAFILVFIHQDPATEFNDDFGHAKPDGRVHQGVDVFAGQGTPIVAGADGKVRRMQRSARSGYYIVLDHADGYSTWYMHLNNDDIGTNNGRGGADAAFAAGLAVGDYVSAGQVIGYVGNSGNAEGTHHHTHFELRRDNRPTNPYRYLVAAEERWRLQTAIEAGETPFS